MAALHRGNSAAGDAHEDIFNSGSDQLNSDEGHAQGEDFCFAELDFQFKLN